MSVKPVYLILLLLWSLSSFAQSSDKYLKVLFQDNGTLYFIKPQTLKAKKQGGELEVDFTYLLAKTEESGEVTVNFTLISPDPVRSIDELNLQTGEDRMTPVSTPELLYIDRKGRKWKSRFSARTNPEALLSLLRVDTDHPIVLRAGQGEILFKANRKWEKLTELLSEKLSVEWQK